MANRLIVSLSPHVHGGDSVSKNMYGVCIALVPALLASLWFFGLGAAIVLATSVLSCVFFEWAITKFLLKRPACTRNPSSNLATFIITHDRVGTQLDVQLDLYDTSGRQLWRHRESGVASGNVYTMDWDMSISGGRPLMTGV